MEDNGRGMTAATGGPPARPPFRELLRGFSVDTALLTTFLVALFVLGVSGGQVVARDGVGIYRTLPIAEIWRLLLDRLPPQAPVWLGRELLLALLILAFFALGYVLAATLRLPPVAPDPADATPGAPHAE